MSANRAWLFIFIYEYPSYHFRGFFDGALSLYLARSHTNFRSHLRASFPAVLLLSERLMAGHIKETVILLFIMAGACLIVFLAPGLFVLFPGILCGIASHLIEPGLKRLLLLINPVLYSQNCGILLSDRIRSSPRMPCRQMLR